MGYSGGNLVGNCIKSPVSATARAPPAYTRASGLSPKPHGVPMIMTQTRNIANASTPTRKKSNCGLDQLLFVSIAYDVVVRLHFSADLGGGKRRGEGIRRIAIEVFDRRQLKSPFAR